MIGTLADALRDMENGVTDYTINGECSCCGGCCSNLLPISEKEIKNIKRYMKKHHIEEQIHVLPTVNEPLDMTCPFRDERARKCLIYEVRPAICRDFRCDKPRKQIQANKTLYHGRYHVVEMRNEFFHSCVCHLPLPKNHISPRNIYNSPKKR